MSPKPRKLGIIVELLVPSSWNKWVFWIGFLVRCLEKKGLWFHILFYSIKSISDLWFLKLLCVLKKTFVNKWLNETAEVVRNIKHHYVNTIAILLTYSPLEPHVFILTLLHTILPQTFELVELSSYNVCIIQFRQKPSDGDILLSLVIVV